MTDPRVTGQPAVETAENEETRSGKVTRPPSSSWLRVAARSYLDDRLGGARGSHMGLRLYKPGILDLRDRCCAADLLADHRLKIFRAIQQPSLPAHNAGACSFEPACFNRRIDQVELLRVKDVYVSQSLASEVDWHRPCRRDFVRADAAKATLYGIDRPRYVMDLIWLHTRAELDKKTARVEQV